MAVVAQLLTFALLLEQAAATKPSFEVAAIKRNVSVETNGFLGLLPGGYFRATNFDVFDLIAFAFRTKPRNLFRSQIIGAPDWTNSERYDINAKMNKALYDATEGDTLRAPKVVRSLLEERFKMQARVEQREMPVYALVVARDGSLGPQMRVSTADCEHDRAKCAVRSFAGRHFSSGGVTLETLAGMLSGPSGRLVVDRTGLKGNYAIDLEWTEEDNAPDKPSIFAAVQEQLGLKLESIREPVDVVVIDHIERPVEE
jgi:uncharacterized protein (TIGR03435 family)